MSSSKGTAMELSNIYEAILDAKSDFTPVNTTGHVRITDRKQWKYNTLDDLLEAVEPALQKRGMLLFHEKKVFPQERIVILITKIMHVKSKENVSDETLLEYNELDIKSLGSAITYARRYAIMGLLGLLPRDDEDTDGVAVEYVSRTKSLAKPQATGNKINAQLLPNIKELLSMCGEKEEMVTSNILKFNKVKRLEDLSQQQATRVLEYISNQLD